MEKTKFIGPWMLDARKKVSGYQENRVSGKRTEDRWRTTDERRVSRIEYRLSAVASAKAEASSSIIQL